MEVTIKIGDLVLVSSNVPSKIGCPDVTIAVQKIVVCSTTGGHIPQYNSKHSLTGCLTDTHFITKLYLVMVNRVVVCVLAFMIL